MFAGLILVACGPPATTQSLSLNRRQHLPLLFSRPSQQRSPTQEVATLNSLEKVDDFPLYTMHYYGSTEPASPRLGRAPGISRRAAASVGLFAICGAGRRSTNSMAATSIGWTAPLCCCLLIPTTGYASVSMVDLAYLEFGDKVDRLTELPLDQRLPLLDAPGLPFDGMNERGLVVGMAAVPDGNVQPDPGKETIDSLQVIRRMLDQAGTVDEAVAVLQQVNIEWGSGPPLHYLIADRSGQAALVEFYQGKLHIIPNDSPWHLATNFLLSSVGGNPTGQCPRYDTIDQRLSTTAGSLDAAEAMRLLHDVSQPNTQWSIVYGLSTGKVTVTMGRKYSRTHTFQIDLMD